MARSPALSVGCLRAAAPSGGVVSARLAAEALLADVAGVRTGLPPQSILLMPKLELAVPAQALVRLPDAALRQRVSTLAGQALHSAAARASWPARGDVPNGAESVVFADQAELLACLARDAVRGELGRWWWRLVLGAHHPDWTKAFSRHPQAVSAALRLLGRMQLAASEHAQLRSALGDTLRKGIELGPSPLQPRALSAQSRPRSAQSHDEARAGVPDGPASGARAADPSEVDVVSSRADSASAAQRGTLAPGLELTARPVGGTAAALHSAAGSERRFCELAAPKEQRGGNPGSPRGSAPVASTRALRPNTEAGANDVTSASSERESVAAPLTGERDQSPDPARPSQTVLQPSPNAPLIAQIQRALSSLRPVHNRIEGLVANPEHQSAFEANVDALHTALATEDGPGVAPASPLPVFTRYGGLFFLINVLLGQELYPDFTRPRDRGFPFPLWVLVALLGRRLVGRRICRDPIWALLLGLETPPIRAEEEDLWSWWSVDVGGQRTAHQSESSAREPSTRQSPAREPSTRQSPARDPLMGWLAEFTPWLRAELGAALGWPVLRVGRRLATLEAKVWVSEGQIVLQMSLDALPVEIRLAGLDRDPGFLPSVGRTLRFVFE